MRIISSAIFAAYLLASDVSAFSSIPSRQLRQTITIDTGIIRPSHWQLHVATSRNTKTGETKTVLPKGSDVVKGSQAEIVSIETDESSSDYTRGMLTIGFITILFSSNSPVLHAAFVNAANPPPVLLLNAATSTIALITLVVFGPILNSFVPLPKTLETDDADKFTTMQAGMELGLWKTLGTTANLYGLSLTSANHAAFLIQLTTLIVPAYQGLTGVPIPNRIWTAIGLALVGIALFTQDISSGGDLAGNTGLMGDALCALAAGFYATYDLRLFDLGKKVAPLPLIRTKIAFQAVLSCGLLALAGDGGIASAYEYTKSMFSSPDDALLIGSAAIWSGFAINAIAPFMQVGGQQTIGASRAQILYASQPLWASFISFFMLNEVLGEKGLAGGFLFLVAIFFAATAESPDPNCGQDDCEI
eukprot:scaffold656_cov271-Chaetoceros_neogracile.AAC.24